MTGQELRERVVRIAQAYTGLSNGGKCPQVLADRYNAFLAENTVKWAGLPRSTRMDTGYPWCACFVSAVAIEAGLAMTALPVEMSCGNLLRMAQAKGIWLEREELYGSGEAEGRAAQPGDLVLYDWADGTDYAETDNTGAPDHVGIITAVSRQQLTVLEGNSSNTVKARTVKLHGRYLRGFICPDYDAAAAEQTGSAAAVEQYTPPELRRGQKTAAVGALQVLLNVRCGEALAVDGSFGPLTQAAVKRAQERFALPTDGVCGDALWQLLLENG